MLRHDTQKASSALFCPLHHGSLKEMAVYVYAVYVFMLLTYVSQYMSIQSICEGMWFCCMLASFSGFGIEWGLLIPTFLCMQAYMHAYQASRERQVATLTEECQEANLAYCTGVHSSRSIQKF